MFAGDLAGLREKIPYLKKLCITYLHLMPMLRMPHPDNDGGYAVDDFKSIDPCFGTVSDLADLTAALRENGISLCMDFVMNHMASTHPWAMAAKKGNRKAMGFYTFSRTGPYPMSMMRWFFRCFPLQLLVILLGVMRSISGSLLRFIRSNRTLTMRIPLFPMKLYAVCCILQIGVVRFFDWIPFLIYGKTLGKMQEFT
ncbi:MAG: alpha-amylase family glycosyl hydrolase [Spirochaetia bacterium]|nr:alpha-amylase family glycosyl hydrolase [Spirochaetia bacterium]